MANTKKQSLVDEIQNTIQETKNFILVKFEKTKHTTLEELRRELKKNDASLSVVKNTLFEKAINKLMSQDKTLENVKKVFPIKESSALMSFKGDWSNALKAFNTFTKKNESMGYKVAHLDSTVYDADSLKRIAELPSKLELLAKVIGGMKSPMAHTTRSMKFNMQKFVYILSQRSQQAE